MRLLKNREVKVIIITITLSFFIFSVISIGIINRWFNNMSSLYAKQNIALTGELLKIDPTLEEIIVPIITKDNNQGNYDLGKSVLQEYGYNENIIASKNTIINSYYKNFKQMWIVFVAILWIILLIVIVLVVKPIFLKLRVLEKISDDIVEGKKDFNKLRFSEGDFATFYNKFINMGERLDNAVTELKEEKINLKDIINDISHQLKTPLAALITYNDILKNHESMDSETKTKFITLTSEQLDRMEWLVTTLLKYARIESNAVTYKKRIVPLKETIEYCIEPLIVYAEEKNQSITFNYNGEGKYFHDDKWIGEAISNIIKNAIEHTGNCGCIEVYLDETPLSVSIEIRDNGEGIEKSEFKNIFKRFYKGKNSINPKSIGIGLSLSRKIVEAHGGSINVESKLGVGTTFHITFLKVVV